MCEADNSGDANALIIAEIGQVLLRKLQCQVRQKASKGCKGRGNEIRASDRQCRLQWTAVQD